MTWKIQRARKGRQIRTFSKVLVAYHGTLEEWLLPLPTPEPRRHYCFMHGSHKWLSTTVFLLHLQLLPANCVRYDFHSTLCRVICNLYARVYCIYLDVTLSHFWIWRHIRACYHSSLHWVLDRCAEIQLIPVKRATKKPENLHSAVLCTI